MMTLREYCALFLSNRPANTERAYRYHIDAFIRWMHDNGRNPLNPSKIDIEKYSMYLMDRKPNTQHAYISAVRSFYRYLYSIDAIRYPIHEATKRIKYDNDNIDKRYLSTHEINKLFISATSSFDHCALTWLYYIGLRVSELCSIQADDIKTSDDKTWVTITGKGGKTRTIPIPSICLEAAARLGWPRHLYLLPSKHDKQAPTHPATIWRHLRKLAQLAGLSRPISPHWLRHAHVSHALDAGCPPQTVQRTVGHSCLSTTSRYSHPKPGESSGTFLAHEPVDD